MAADAMTGLRSARPANRLRTFSLMRTPDRRAAGRGLSLLSGQREILLRRYRSDRERVGMHGNIFAELERRSRPGRHPQFLCRSVDRSVLSWRRHRIDGQIVPAITVGMRIEL